MIKLSFDVNSGQLIAWRGSMSALPQFRQGSHEIQLRFATPNPTVAAANTYIPADVSAYLGPRLGIFTSTTFTLDDSEGFALAAMLHTDFTYNEDDSDDPYFSGTFNLNTQPIADLGSAKTSSVFFSAGLVRTDLNFSPIYDHRGAANATLYCASDDGFGSLPVSVVRDRPTIQLPVYLLSADGDREYLMDENADHTGVEITAFTPP